MTFFARALAFAAAALVCAGALAEERSLPVPRMTIYPGDLIRDTMLRSDTFDVGGEPYVFAASDIVGRVARRTLLAGRPILVDAVEDPRAVSNGALVQMIYTQPGLEITASGQALQAGRVGDSIRVRNVESGLVVSGLVTADGTVRVDR
jgi:flagellar basal body P-ring formation protein FlgA